MQSDLVSYQRTISRIESIMYFDTPAAAVHHLKAEKVRCEEREYVPQQAHRLTTYAHCLHQLQLLQLLQLLSHCLSSSHYESIAYLEQV